MFTMSSYTYCLILATFFVGFSLSATTNVKETIPFMLKFPKTLSNLVRKTRHVRFPDHANSNNHFEGGSFNYNNFNQGYNFPGFGSGNPFLNGGGHFHHGHGGRRQVNNDDIDNSNNNQRPSWQNQLANNQIFFDNDNEFGDFVRPNNNNNNIPNTPLRTTTPSIGDTIPGMGTPRTPCEDACLTTPQYNPVCGDNDITYFNVEKFRCAQRCGKRIRIKFNRSCEGNL